MILFYCIWLKTVSIAYSKEQGNMLLRCYYCFSPRWILRLPRYSLTFGFPWTRPSVQSPWYQWHNCSFNMTRIQALFWLGNTSNWQGLLRCASHFLFCARFLWRSAIRKLTMKWYPMRTCTRWLCPFDKLIIFMRRHFSVLQYQGSERVIHTVLLGINDALIWASRGEVLYPLETIWSWFLSSSHN